MATDKGFIAPGGGGANRAHVERTALLAEIDAELARSGIVVLRAPWGYGRTTLMRDYARIAHARTPGRPVVRVDFDTYESQSFLNGNREPLLRSLAHLAKDADRGGERAAGGAVRRPSRRGRVPSLRKMPPQHASDATQLMYECIAAAAPGWCARLEGGAPPDAVPFRDLPLVTVDNLPPMDEQALGVLADAMTAWSQAGARLLLACSPSTLIAKSLLPTAFVIGATALSVSRSEIGLWSQGLRFAEGIDIAGATAGVPMLVDACRSVQEGDPCADEAFLRASDRVLEHCLDELMYGAAERCRWAMAMLGRGTLADLASVGVSMRDDELAILHETYPLLGIDMLKGTFRCIPMSCGRDSGAALRAVGGDEALSTRCVELLVRRGSLKRAGELAALLSGTCRLRLFGRNPDAFADAANSGSIERSMKAILVGEEIDAALRPGLARLAQLHAVAHDVPLRMLPDYVLQHSSGSSEGALHAVKSVLGFWRAYSGPGEARAGEAGEDAPCWERDVVVGWDGGGEHPAGGVDGIVHAMGEAALRGDAKAYLARLDALRDAVDLSDAGLASATYASHAALCAFLCDRAETALELVEPLAGALRDADAPAGYPTSVSQALVGASYAVARLLVERPSSVRIAAGALESVVASRRFFEERRIEPATAYALFLEALCMLSAGDERGAAVPLARCRARWGAQGTLLGQLAGGLALCVTDFAQDAVNQAAVHARAAEALAQRLGIRRAVWLARLFGSVSAIRNGNAPDLDRRLLEGTLRRSALHPATSVELELELALLHAARGDAAEARDIFRGVGVFDRPCACRLLVVAVRGLGRSRSCVLDLLPRRLRSEYEALRPSSTFKRYAGVAAAEPAALPGQGLLALPTPGKGLSIGLLGGLRASVNGHAVGVGAWGRRKSRIILQVLALYPETPVGRDTLIEILWEGSEPNPLLRNNLNTALSSLRASLGQKGGGPQYIVTMGGAVGFDLDLVDVDVLRFERLARMVLARRNVGDPLELMDACSTLEQLFQTGFGPEFQSLPRKVRQRVKEIEDLFVESMLLGASVALSEGDCQLSMWFARAAARVSSRREDVRGALNAAADALSRLQAGEADMRAAAKAALRGGAPDAAAAGARVPDAAASGGQPAGGELPALVGEVAPDPAAGGAQRLP